VHQALVLRRRWTHLNVALTPREKTDSDVTLPLPRAEQRPETIRFVVCACCCGYGSSVWTALHTGTAVWPSN